MFKLKPGNVFQKMQKMNKKQAYTIGGIVVALFIALLTLASFMGDAEETSFDGMNTRGYDLAQMPFVNDEAEEYLLASRYPDMQGNNSTMLYSSSEKKDRQEEDAKQAEEKAAEDGAKEAQSGADSSTGHGYGGRGGYSGGRGGAGTPTQVGQLGSASMGRSGGSGVSATWGAPRGDFSPYKSQDKGSEIPTTQLKNQDAKRALAQFAQTSRAAAGLRDGKSANAKRALMGGRITGSEAFTDSGVDLSKTGGLALDTNAPVTSADLSNLGDKVSEQAKQAEKKKEEEKQSLADRLMEQFLSGLVNMAMNSMGKMIDKGVDSLFASMDAYSDRSAFNSAEVAKYTGLKPTDTLTPDQRRNMDFMLGGDGRGIALKAWQESGQDFGTYASGNSINLKSNMKAHKDEFIVSRSTDKNGTESVQTLGLRHREINREAYGSRGVFGNNNDNSAMNCPKDTTYTCDTSVSSGVTTKSCYCKANKSE